MSGADDLLVTSDTSSPSESTTLCSWDTGYIFSRPHSFKDGILFPIWAAYGKYEGVDLIYSRKAWEDKLGFTAAQGE